jgi:hypothetical protein
MSPTLIQEQVRGVGWRTVEVEKRISPLRAHDDAVSSFGRNDGFLGWAFLCAEKRTGNGYRGPFQGEVGDTAHIMLGIRLRGQ